MNIDLGQILLDTLAIDVICAIIILRTKMTIEEFNWIWKVTAISGVVFYFLIGWLFMTSTPFTTMDPFRATGNIQLGAIIVAICPGIVFCTIKIIVQELKWRISYYRGKRK